MQANSNSAAVSETPSSGSDDSDLGILEESAFTVEWARELLIDQGVVAPQEIHIVERSAVTGPLSRVLTVTVRYESEGERHSIPLVVKLPPQERFGRFLMAEAQFDTREIYFYTKLVPALNKLAREALGPDEGLPVPRCLKYMLPDEIGGISLLVLEDVTAIGFESTEFAVGLTVEKARAALFAAARLHALSFGLRDREGPLDEVFDFLFPCERAATGYMRLIQKGLPPLIDFLRVRRDCAAETAAICALNDRVPSLLATLLTPTDTAPLAHADFWSGNLLFRERDGKCECVALDWQMISLCRPMDDVALLLLSSLTPDLRRSAGDSLIKEYYDRLHAECAKLGVSSDAVAARKSFKKEWPRAALRALLLCAGSVDVALGEPRSALRLLEAVRDLYKQGILDFKVNK